MHALHFRKGCFVGQEIIGKTVSMSSNAVRRRLCAITVPVGTIVAAGDSVIDEDGMLLPPYAVFVRVLLLKSIRVPHTILIVLSNSLPLSILLKEK